MSFSDILQTGSLVDIATWLDNQTPDDRLQAIQSLNKAEQRTLFEKCVDTEPLTLDYFCAEPNVEVIHDGKNSLPAFQLFQKRFVRLEDNRVVGYNHASTMGVIGPGYFVLKETSENQDWTQHGSVVVDYYEVLDANTPYKHITRSKAIIKVCRCLCTIKCTTLCSVSTHVSIGCFQERKEHRFLFPPLQTFTLKPLFLVKEVQ